MPLFLPRDAKKFPDNFLWCADEHGIVAIGGDDLLPELLISAYKKGVFPWPHEGSPLLWFCPDPRHILKPAELHIGMTLKKTLKRSSLDIRFNENFSHVMKMCQTVKRPGQNGTWITDKMIESYTALHHLGYAKSVEAYDGAELIGGLYGISLSKIFFGESMFSRFSNASTMCLIALSKKLAALNFTMIDCQAKSAHLERLGAKPMPRADFLKELAIAIQ